MIFYIVLVIFILLIYIDTRKPAYYPPGPQWMPLVGNFLQFRQLLKQYKLTHRVWEKLASKYGSLLGLRLGSDRLVIVSGYKMIREVLNKEEFEGRPDGFFFRLRAFGQKLGVAFIDGPIGQDQRRFCLQNLKSFGFGRSAMEQRIILETSELVSWLKIKCKDEKSLRTDCMFGTSILNTIWTMLAGQRYDLDDERLKELLLSITKLFRIVDMSGGLINQMPFIRFIAPGKMKYYEFVNISNKLNGFLRETIEEHKRTYKPEETRDVIDAFLHEIERHKHEKFTIYHENQLVVLLLDMFMAGAETTSSTLSFAVLYMLHYPDVQKHAQSELDITVGKGNQPVMQHLSRLSYIEAIIMEVQRICNIAPITAAHRAKSDTKVSGYIIPKDTTVLASIYSVHMDNEHWGDPENFRPERFINNEGKIIQDEWFIPFSLGKRRCLGETLARGSLFLFFSTILHNFIISSPPAEPLPSLEQIDGATLCPLPFYAVFTPRF